MTKFAIHVSDELFYKQHIIMIVQVFSHVSAYTKVKTHIFRQIKPFNILSADKGGEKNFALSVKCDKTTIEQPVICSAEEKPIINTQAFFIRADRPGLDVTCNKQFRMVDASYYALPMILIKKDFSKGALPYSRRNNCFSLSFRDFDIGLYTLDISTVVYVFGHCVDEIPVLLKCVAVHMIPASVLCDKIGITHSKCDCKIQFKRRHIFERFFDSAFLTHFFRYRTNGPRVFINRTLRKFSVFTQPVRKRIADLGRCYGNRNSGTHTLQVILQS